MYILRNYFIVLGSIRDCIDCDIRAPRPTFHMGSFTKKLFHLQKKKHRKYIITFNNQTIVNYY